MHRMCSIVHVKRGEREREREGGGGRERGREGEGDDERLGIRKHGVIKPHHVISSPRKVL